MKLFELQADLKVGRISGREENVERFRRLCRSHSRFCWTLFAVCAFALHSEIRP